MPDGKLRNMASVYLTDGERILLLYRRGGRVSNEMWVASAGGHFEPAELNDARACVLRELYEELGLWEGELDDLRLRYVTLRRTNGEIRQNYYFFAGLRDPGRELRSNEGLLRWFDVLELPGLVMPFSAKYVLEHYVNSDPAERGVYAGVSNGERIVFMPFPEN